MGLTSKPTPHPTPLDEDLLDSLRLIRSRRVSAATWHRLRDSYGSARAALAALPDIARNAGAKDYATFSRDDALREIMAGQRVGATALLWGRPDYPKALYDLPDAPPVLWAKGDIALLKRSAIAVIGARNASSIGIRMARKLVEGLSGAPLCIVSGLARGIDTEAHRASLDSGTIAVMAGGLDVIYPLENTALAHDIALKGCLISEQAMGMRPMARHFPQRNRIVSGLARAVVVVEATARSGSLITARLALDQGREVMAVPGHPFDPRAYGCLNLLRDGASLVRGPSDVLEALGIDAAQPAPREDRAALNADAPAKPVSQSTPQRVSEPGAIDQRILDQLGANSITEDQLIRDLGLPAATISAQLLNLELDGKINRAPGGVLSKSFT